MPGACFACVNRKEVLIMQEIRLHGRGGQGVRFAARVLSRALFLSGYQTQDFAIYGAERRGAPVTSFVRFDKKPILERGYVFEPDIVVLLDDTLNFAAVAGGLKSGGFALANSRRNPYYFTEKFSIKQKVHCIDATQIALQAVGKPIANAAIVGALAKLLPLEMKKVGEAMLAEFEEEGLESIAGKNIEAAKKCFEEIK